MEQFGMQPEEQEEKVSHNIFSSENYGIGRLEFLGANSIIYFVLYILYLSLGAIFALCGADKASTMIFVNIIGVPLATYLFTMNFAHRMYHIGWTDELNSRSIAAMIAIVLCVGSVIPLINIFIGVIFLIWSIILTLVPGDNE